MPTKVRANFIEPMLLQRTATLPDDATRWEYQLKLDGYRAVSFKAAVACVCSPAMATTSARGTRPS